MPVPFEALIPYGIMGVMFGISGLGLASLSSLQNGGKRNRYNVGRWEEEMMRRDARLTGYTRGQTDNPTAPEGFAVNNPWKVEFLTR